MTRPQSLLLTRPEAASRDFAAALEAALPGRFEAVIAPVMGIEARADVALDLDGVQALLFSSANGVACLAARTARRDLPAWCVGDLTARAAREAGFAALSASGDVAALAALARAETRPGAGVLLHVRGEHAAGDLAGALAADGIAVRAAEIYRQVPCAITGDVAARLDTGGIAVVALFSPRSARLFGAQARAAGWPLGGVTAVSLSGAADAALETCGFGRRMIADRPDRDAMIAALARA